MDSSQEAKHATFWLTVMCSTIRPHRPKKHFLKSLFYSLYFRLQAKRVEALGYDLSAAHFVVSGGGAVKFLGREAWYVRNKDGKSTLPNIMVKDLYIEAINCSNIAITQEAFENFGKSADVYFNLVLFYTLLY